MSKTLAPFARALVTYLTVAAMAFTLMVGAGTTATADALVFTSSANVDTWDPIFPSTADPTWDITTCVPTPAVGLGASWVNPHKAYAFGTGAHPWQNDGTAGFSADWINAWGNIYSQGPSGQSWTKYSTQISGNGDFVLNLLADNCSWIYLDGTLVGFQGAYDVSNAQARKYPVQLSGSHSLAFLIFDGGGAAGGMYRLETNTSTVFPTTTTVTFGPGPFVAKGSAFTATATVSIGSVIQSVTATIAYTGDCVNPGNTCTATATYAGDATHLPSSAVASITITAPLSSPTYDSLCTLATGFSTKAGVATALCAKLSAASASAARGDATSRTGQLGAFINQVSAQSGKALTAEQAAILTRLAKAL